jgi:hypothetical protein
LLNASEHVTVDGCLRGMNRALSRKFTELDIYVLPIALREHADSRSFE